MNSKSDIKKGLVENSIEIAEIGKFKISKAQLVSIMHEYQNREFAEEVKYLSENNGLEWLEKGLKTNYVRGLNNDENELKERKEKYGSNEKPPVVSRSFCELFYDALQDDTLKILMVAAVVSMVISTATAKPEDRSHSWIEGFAILVAVFVCSMVAAVNDFQKEKQFQSLNQVADEKKKYSVYRDGNLMELHHSQIMVGDVIKIQEGMDIPCDGVIIECAEIYCDEAAMTGETDPMRKDVLADCVFKMKELQNKNSCYNSHDVSSPCMMSGTKVLTGEGKFVAIVIGEESCEGKVGKLLREEDDSATPLQMKLEAIANDIGKFGLISAIIIVGALLVRLAIEKVLSGQYGWSDIKEILNFFIIGVTVVVVAIPEGLPLAVTLSLAFSIKRMLKDNNLVRKLQACETMGGANMICSDKTGTLTQNKMTLTSIWNQSTIPIDNYKNRFDLRSIIPSEMKDIFVQSLVFNTSAQLRPYPKGNQTEISILEFIDKAQVNIDYELQAYPIIKKMPFNSKRKRMTIILDIGFNKYRVLIKGASEFIAETCSHFHSFNNQIEKIDKQLQEKIDNSISNLASDGLRTIGYAYKDVDVSEYKNQLDVDDLGVFNIEKAGFKLLVILGIRDVLRPEVPGAISNCKKAGIKVRMVTGDNKITAKAIAIECGIIDRNDDQPDNVMEGSEFMKRIGGTDIKNQIEFDKIIKNLCVLARSRPEDKYALVNGLIQRGNVVAVTGDGTNDAPALKKADVGFAMGINGTEVARESAEIILLDDNFSSIVKAVMWGRNIYDNIKKFLQFQLTVNVVAVFSTLIGAVVLKQEIMTPIQMLWVNLIMDSLASLALATESPTIDLLYRPPHKKNEYIVTQNMFKHIAGQSIYQMIVLMIVCFRGEYFLHEVKDDLDVHIQQKLSQQDAQYIGLGGMLMKYKDNGLDTVRSGRFKTISDTTKLYPAFNKQYQGLDYLPIGDLLGPSRHFTLLFNIFVWMTIFNFVNARLLNDQVNVFKGILSNYLFGSIVGIIAIMQIVLVMFGGKTFSCYQWGPYHGLHYTQWIYCVGFGIGGMIVSVILKMIPDTLFGQYGSKEQDPFKRESVLSVRRSISRKSLVGGFNRQQSGNFNRQCSGNFNRQCSK